MEYGIGELKEKLDLYFSGKLSKRELGVWAERAYYDLLKGGYLENSKIILYPFLKKISQIHVPICDIEDRYPCSEEEVKNIRSIINGKGKMAFCLEIGIPIQVYNIFGDVPALDASKRELLKKIREELCDYFNKIAPLREEMMIDIETFLNTKFYRGTIMALLEDTIRTILKAMFIIEPDGNIVSETPKLAIFPLKASQNSIKNKLLEYLDCYIGNRNFYILVSYDDGFGDISVII